MNAESKPAMTTNAKDLTARRKAIEAERREFLKPQKRFEKFFQNRPLTLSKARVREMTIAALCTAEALRGCGMTDKERLARAETIALNGASNFYFEEYLQRQALRHKAA